MCMFCAAIPMSAAMGTAITRKQKESHQSVIGQGEPTPHAVVPAGKITVAVTGGLIVCAAAYHLVVFPHTGAII